MNRKDRVFEYISKSTGWQIKEMALDIKAPLYIKISYELALADWMA